MRYRGRWRARVLIVPGIVAVLLLWIPLGRAFRDVLQHWVHTRADGVAAGVITAVIGSALIATTFLMRDQLAWGSRLTTRIALGVAGVVGVSVLMGGIANSTGKFPAPDEIAEFERRLPGFSDGFKTTLWVICIGVCVVQWLSRRRAR